MVVQLVSSPFHLIFRELTYYIEVPNSALTSNSEHNVRAGYQRLKLPNYLVALPSGSKTVNVYTPFTAQPHPSWPTKGVSTFLRMSISEVRYLLAENFSCAHGCFGGIQFYYSRSIQLPSVHSSSMDRQEDSRKIQVQIR